jgi:ribosomal protein S18 acetylase RimI-like enzyme
MNPSIDLQLMSQKEYEDWLPGQCNRYAEDKVRAGNWPSAGALERSNREMAGLLPDGLRTPGHDLYNIIDTESSVAVGQLWIKRSTIGPVQSAYIYNIEIREDQRGRGFAAAAICAIEVILARQGITQLSLHVFGFNNVAQRLYQRLGFLTTNVSMSKEISPNRG